MTAEILPSVKKTRLMATVEQRFAQPGEQLGDVLHRLVAEENKTFRAIGRYFSNGTSLHVSDITVRTWTNKFHPELTDQNLKSRATFITWEDPEIRKVRTEAMNSAKTTNTESVLTSLGPNPRETLAPFVAQNDSVEEIAERFGTSLRYMHMILQQCDLKTTGYNKRRDIPPEEIEARRIKILRIIDQGSWLFLSLRQRKTLAVLYNPDTEPPTQSAAAREMHTLRENVNGLEKRAFDRIDRLLELPPSPSYKKPQRRGPKDKDIDMWLARTLYWSEGINLEETAKILGVGSKTLRARMKKLNIPARPAGRPKNKVA